LRSPIHLLGVVVTLAFGMALVLAAPVETDPTGFQPPAWYDDPELGVTWKRFTGRYIFERTCTSCHRWGPSYWPRDQWQTVIGQFAAFFGHSRDL